MAKRPLLKPPVLGGFTYIRPLGSGGFADVFLYEQDMPRRVAAVKVLHRDVVNLDVLRTFNAEADVMARLSSHPAIVTIFQASISADGRPYLAMEYCPENMSARYKRAPLSVAEVLDTGVRVGGALETAHRAGMLHRDIKPSNILMTSMRLPVLADFGIAASISAGEDETETVALSVPWSAPEVLSGEVTGTIASEVWSFGATLYTLLAGRSPFELEDKSKNTRDQLSARVMRARYRPIGRSDLPPQVDGTLAKAMNRDPADRYPTIAALVEALMQLQAGFGLAVTSFEVADPDWSAAAPVNFQDTRVRGPVITTVSKKPRKAARAKRRLIEGATDRDGLPVADPKRARLRAGLVGGAVGALVVVAALVVWVVLSGG